MVSPTIFHLGENVTEELTIGEPILFWSKGPSPWRLFSAFDMSSFEYQEIRYSSLEHWYQAHKMRFAIDFRAMLSFPNSAFCKEYAKLHPHVEIDPQKLEDWKLQTMYFGMKLLYDQNDGKRTLLVSTGDRELVHFAPWGDTYWGVGRDHQGQNHQGKILMRVRKELRDS